MNGMEVAKFAGAVLIFTLGSHLALRTAPAPWNRAKRERREQTLRRLADVVRSAQPPQPLVRLEPNTWHAADFSRYFVPMGLRLDQARRVVREAREADKREARC